MPSQPPIKTVTRTRPKILRALGTQDPPCQIRIGETGYQRVEVFKHDSWAATALYESNTTAAESRRLVCKFNRVQSICGIPMAWLGRALATREARAYRLLTHLPGVPGLAEEVYADNQRLPHAVAHDFVEGHPLKPGEQVGDDFFPELQSMLTHIHRAGMAYVDLHKRENILVGSDGRPHLIDFQISFQPRWQALWKMQPWSFLQKILQVSDEFCLAKHVRNHRPDQLKALRLDAFTQPPWWIRAHRMIAVPFRQARRRLLALIGVRDRSGRAISERFAEHAFRCQLEEN